ncbi:MAG: hypothetical protein ACFFG0_41815 [Candidatus Thorarchaeota archaeon]
MKKKIVGFRPSLRVREILSKKPEEVSITDWIDYLITKGWDKKTKKLKDLYYNFHIVKKSHNFKITKKLNFFQKNKKFIPNHSLSL